MQAQEFNALASLFAKGGNVEYALICRGLRDVANSLGARKKPKEWKETSKELRKRIRHAG
jgi:hypothetical protein